MNDAPSDQPPAGESEHSNVLAERREKLERLRAAGVEPFPHSFPDRVEIATVRDAHAGLAAGEETESARRVAGRLLGRRGHGKAAFLDIADGSGRIQLHSRADVLGDESHEALVGLDLGDFVGVDGAAFETRRGELSLRVTGWTLLAKGLRPLPDKFHGLEDTETRLRRRELDLIANPEVRERFATRSRLVAAVRRTLDDWGFLEVETPVLQPLYGGALARPFTTHHNALDRDLYLRIATELYLKRCVVGGIDRVYELGKDFRNEGISPKHNPEFTMLEFYEAYADYNDTAERLEQLVAGVAEATLGTTKVTRGDAVIDFAPPWRRMTSATPSASARGSTSPSTPRERRSPRRWGSSRTPGRAGASSSTACSRATWSRTSPSPPSSSTTRWRCRRSPSATAPRRAWSSAGRRSPAGSRSPTRSRS